MIIFGRSSRQWVIVKHSIREDKRNSILLSEKEISDLMKKDVGPSFTK
jgi:hypothetical protein